MEINLLPPKPLIERIFWLVFSLLVLMLTAIGYFLFQLHENKEQRITELEQEIQTHREQQKQMEETSRWNQQVQQKEEELKQIRQYQAFAEGLEANLGPDWSVILLRITSSLPAQSEIVEISSAANELTGIIAFSNLKDIARFMHDLERAPEISKADVQIIDHPNSTLDISEPYIQQLSNKQLTIIAEFRLYTVDIDQKPGEKS